MEDQNQEAQQSTFNNKKKVIKGKKKYQKNTSEDKVGTKRR